MLLARLAESGGATEPLLRLYGSDGVQVDGISSGSMAELPLTDLPGSDTYTLLVMDSPGLDTGGYSLHIQRINNPVGASTLNYGATVNGSVAERAQTRAYTLADSRDIDPVGRITPTEGRDLTLLQQLFGNIGRFSSDALQGQ